MKILSCEQIRETDLFTINNEPIQSIDLMERAAKQCFNWLKVKFDNSRIFKIFTGPGNNGGDGLAIARMLFNEGYQVMVYLLANPEKLSPDALINYNRCLETGNYIHHLETDTDIDDFGKNDIIIDAIFGSGLSRVVEGIAASAIDLINKSNLPVISIDIPSGLFADNNTINNNSCIVRAHYTLTFQIPKLAFLFAENEPFVGELVILDIQLHKKGIEMQESDCFLTEIPDIKRTIKKRPKFAHKGSFGHALLIAGSYGKMGAVTLSSKACLRAGVGLLTSHIPKTGYAIVQSAIPEAMVSIDSDDEIFTLPPDLFKYTAIGIGPGIGTNTQTALALSEIIKLAEVPIVLDADAINIISNNPGLLGIISENTILTPHPGEFDRLVGPSKTGYDRYLKQIEFSKKHKIIVVLKGAYTSISNTNGRSYFNSTGNPGMATAGSGDVLTGIILSLLAQGYKPLDAAIAGVFIHGLAGDISLEDSSQEALIASDIINNLGKAFKKVIIY
jgi:NAD(P)H-hydrate epimerase